MNRDFNKQSSGRGRPSTGTYGLVTLFIGLNLVLASCWTMWTDLPSWGWGRGSTSQSEQPAATPTPFTEQTNRRVPPPVVPTPYAVGWATPTPVAPGADSIEMKPNLVPTSTPAPTATPLPVITNADLERALITPDDLPGSWSSSSLIDLRPGSQNSICNVPGPDTVVAPVARAQAQYQQTDFGPFVLMNTSAFTTTSDAQVVMSYLRQAISCDTWYDESLDRDWQISTLSFPDKGDERFSVELSTSLGFLGTARVHAVFVRTGTVITLIANGAVGSVDIAETERLVDLAVRNVNALP